MIILGLTGSIGMGKSTTADLFAEEGVPVYSADAAVHALYREKETIAQIEAIFPNVVRNGAIDRKILSRQLVENPAAIKQLEAMIHPLLRPREQEFLTKACAAGAKLVVLDIPLLYETGAAARVDYVAVVSAPEAIQRQRVLARPGMSEEKFNMLLARQLPDSEKRKRADFILNSDAGIEKTRQEVRQLIKTLTEQERSEAM